MSKDSHGFSVSVACEVGVPGAIMLQHLLTLQKASVSGEESWQEKWIRRSAKSFSVTYPYWSGKQISGILDGLEKNGYTASKIENANKYDRTKSYILTGKGIVLMGEKEMPKGDIAFPQMENGESETENVDLPFGEMSIKEDCSSFCNPFVEEEKGASLSSASKKDFSLEAEKEKTLPADAGGETPGGQSQARDIKVVDPDLPGVTIYDQVSHKNYPTLEPQGEFKRVNVPEEIERMRNDPAVLEGFVIGQKIAKEKFADYLDAFRVDVLATDEKYAKIEQLRRHFLNWCGCKREHDLKRANKEKAQQPQSAVYEPNPYKRK